MWYYRPVLPYGWSVNAYLPIITGVLGLEFGTMLDASLNYLYYNNYTIDGYADNIVYLRDVAMLNYQWPDAMLRYNDRGLEYAEFSVSSDYRDDSRYEALYAALCNEYGDPINGNDNYVSWYGGDGVGYVNLGVNYNDGRYYTLLSFGR